MHNSKIVFVINDEVRAMRCEFDPNNKHDNRPVYKTLDPTIEVDDIVIVQTESRVGFTAVKVVEADVTIDLDLNEEIKWIAAKLDTKGFTKILDQETEAIKAVQESERARKKREMRKAMFEGQEEAMQTLSLTHIEEKEK